MATSGLTILLLLALAAAGCGGGGAADGDTVPDGDSSTDGDTPVDGDTAADGDTAPDGDDPVDGDQTADGDAPPLPWVSISPAGRYYQDEQGDPFFPIGIQPGSGVLMLSPAELEAFFADMEEYGENVVRVYADEVRVEQGIPSMLSLEGPVGSFNEGHAARLERLFAAAGRHGVRVLLAPWVEPLSVWPSWPVNPYNTTAGGPAADPYQFMTGGSARTAYAARLAWASERFGTAGNLFGWELMSQVEVLLNWMEQDDPEALASWVDMQGRGLAHAEGRLHGRTHPATVSWSRSLPPADYLFLFTSAGTDTASSQPYDLYGSDLLRWPNTITSMIGPAVAVRQKILTAGLAITDRRPWLEGERHGNDTTPHAFQREAEHAMAWAETASGAAGAGFPRLHVGTAIDDGWRRIDRESRHAVIGPSHRALRRFVDEVVPDEFFLGLTSDEAADGLATAEDSGVAPLSIRRGRYLIGWLAGLDERCGLAEAINEVRTARVSGPEPPLLEAGLAALLWVAGLQSEGVTLDAARFQGLIGAIQAVDQAAIERELDASFDYLETLETAHGTLARLSVCPRLSPRLTFKLPAGRYTVTWVNDETGQPVRTDDLASGTGSLTSPAFERHLAVCVRPAG